MPSPFDRIRTTTDQPAKAFKPQAVSIQVAGHCGCGFEGALMVTFVPGIKVPSECPQCHATFEVAIVKYDVRDKSGRFEMAVSTQPPLIARPELVLPKV